MQLDFLYERAGGTRRRGGGSDVHTRIAVACAVPAPHRDSGVRAFSRTLPGPGVFSMEEFRG